MSTFEQHKHNIEDLIEIGFDFSEWVKDGEINIDSWDRDNLIDIVEVIIFELHKQKFKVHNHKTGV